jgi:hypothetical protein
MGDPPVKIAVALQIYNHPHRALLRDAKRPTILGEIRPFGW